MISKILIVNTYGLGDVLFTMPVVRNLRLAYPQAHITYLGNSRVEDILKINPDINDILVYERDDWIKIYRTHPLQFIFKWFYFIRQLRRCKYDVVFDFSLNGAFGFIWILAGIKQRVGYNYKGRGRWLNKTYPLEGYDHKHVVEYCLDLLKLVDVPIVENEVYLPLDSESDRWVNAYFHNNHVDLKKPLIAVIPAGGASWGKAAAYRRWPVVNFAQLTDKIVEELNGIVILLGSPSERELAQSLISQTKHPILNLVGQTSILQMAAIMRRCILVVANDAGPMHVAAACKTKTVLIFGPVDPHIYGPYPLKGHAIVTANMPCQPCYRRFRMSDCNHVSCLSQISVEQIFSQVKTSLTKITKAKS